MGRSQVAAGVAPEGIGKARFNTKSVALVTLALVLVLGFLVFFSHRGVFQIYRLRQEKTLLDTENQKLAEENAKLARTVDRLHNDPEMIQDLIRRELNFVKKNEVIIQLPSREEENPVKAAVLPDRPPPPPAREGTEKRRPRGPNRATADPKKNTP
jgi:cell division protein FtsB